MRAGLMLSMCATLLSAAPLAAQVPMPQLPDPRQMEQFRQVAQQMMNPAAMVLARRAELGLTAQQGAALEPVSQEMSTVVQRMLEPPPPSAVQMRMAQAVSDTTIVLDQAALHADLCERAARQAEYMIASLRAQRAVQRVLTPQQREQMQALQLNAGMQMMRGMVGGAPGQ